jgi:hypothetical protein
MVALFGTLGIAGSAESAMIDFTNAAAWSGANGNWIYSSLLLFDGVTVTVASQGPGALLTFNSGADVNPTCAGITGLSCQGDGLGVSDDEVTRGSSLLDPTLERIQVTFSAPVTITQLGFLDLFGANLLTGDLQPETAMWAALTSTGFQDGSLTGTDTSSLLGYKTIATNYTDVSAIQFFATTPPASTNTDFAVASIRFTRTVPEPATLFLSAVGVLVAGASRARHRRSA